MANDEHVAVLMKGVDAWNEWRREDCPLPPKLPDLSSMRFRQLDD